MPAMPANPAIDRLRAMIQDDSGALAGWAESTQDDAFLDRAMAFAADHDIPVDRSELALLLQARVGNPVNPRLPGPVRSELPPPGWLPVELLAINDAVMVQWLWFGDQPPAEPFYDQAVARAWRSPLNRFADWVTPLAALEGLNDEPPPDGLVFHMSRCGSTLVAQMLGAMPDAIVVSEPPILDLAFRLAAQGIVPRETVRLVLAALLRSPDPARAHRFAKLDAWHTLALGQFRELFPDTPWAYLYREPLEVLASQVREPGLHMVPGYIPFDLYGLTGTQDVAIEDISAHVLAAICERALAAMASGKGLLVDYRQLPGAVGDLILPHFGIVPDSAQQALLHQRTAHHSKRPDRRFTPDSGEKRASAGPRLEAQAQGPLGQAYQALEAARRTAG